jgi:hypothetical protein
MTTYDFMCLAEIELVNNDRSKKLIGLTVGLSTAFPGLRYLKIAGNLLPPFTSPVSRSTPV